MTPRVEDFMSTPVVVVEPSASLAHARRLMIKHRVGRLVVVDESGRPVGILTRNDIVRALAGSDFRRSLDSITVEEAMTREPVVVQASRPLREAARLMLHHMVSGLPVVDEKGRLAGIITKTDVVRAYVERLRDDLKVEKFMYRDVPTVYPTHSVAYVAELLEQHPSHRVLVVDGGVVVGIVAPSDLAFLTLAGYARGKEKRVRRFGDLPKGKLGPVYFYNVPVAADVMTPDPVTVKQGDRLVVAAVEMLRGGFSSVPVVDEDGAPLGLVDKHSVLRAVVEKG